MRSSRVRALLAALLLSACAPAAPAADAPQAEPAAAPAPTTAAVAAPPPTAVPAADDSPWVDAGGGLSVRLTLPPGPYRLDATIDVGLEFRNDGDAELRVYLLQSPVFRAQQSDLALFTADGKFLAAQPEPHPHGYVVGERDFPAIAPDKTVRFTQPLRLDREDLGSASGELQLRWTYRNNVESWAGGVQTLDGPTQPLFGGGPIPGIWLGEIKATVPLPLTR